MQFPLAVRLIICEICAYIKETTIGFKPSLSFSALFAPCCCSICYLQNTKLWALPASPPLNWMMPLASCGRHTPPPLLTHSPNSRTGKGNRAVSMEDPSTSMTLWKDGILTNYMSFHTLGICSLGSALPSTLSECRMTREGWLPRPQWPVRLWAWDAGSPLRARAWFRSCV